MALKKTPTVEIMTRFAGQAIKGTPAEEALKSSQGLGDPSAIASMHLFPGTGQRGGINDGDPNMYVHSDEESYRIHTDPRYADPIEDRAPGSGENHLVPMSPDQRQESGEFLNYYQEQDRRQMGGSGDLARMAPKTKEDFQRKRRVLEG